MALSFKVLKWTRVSWKVWSKSCKDCALKRGWSKQDLARQPYPFVCVHQLDERGQQRVCAGDKKKAEQFNKERGKSWG